MAKPNKREIVKEYCEILEGELKQRFGGETTLYNLVYHMVEKGTIRPTEVRKKVILKDYLAFLKENDGMKMRAIYECCNRHEISEVTVYKSIKVANKNSSKGSNIL